MPRFAFLLLFTLLSTPLFAQDATPSDDPYTVTGIAVDVKGANGSEARDRAFTDGGRLALAAVAERLTGAKGDFAAVDNNTITRLIKSFEVEEEKASGTRYIGKLTFHFRPQRTDAFLSGRGMAVRDTSEIQAVSAAPQQRIIVLPIIRSGDRSVLWEEKTEWARAFENYLSDNPNPNIVLPDGGMEDISSITAAEALAGIPAPLMKIMRHYDAQGALVAVLATENLSPQPAREMNVQLAVFDANAAMKSTSSFNLPAAPQKNAMEWLQEGAGASIAKWKSVAEKTAVAASKSTAATTGVVTQGGLLQIALNVPIASPQQWQATRSALQETQGVTNFNVVSLTHTRATVLVTYRGTRPMFETALAEKGLRIEQSAPNGPLMLVSASMPGGPPVNASPQGSTFQTVYPPPTPRDEIIYAEPPSTSNNGDEDNTNSEDEDSSKDSSKAPPPPVTSKKVPPPPPQELPPLIP